MKEGTVLQTVGSNMSNDREPVPFNWRLPFTFPHEILNQLKIKSRHANVQRDHKVANLAEVRLLDVHNV